MKVATTLAFGVAPHAIGKDHPEGVLAGVHSNYHFTYPGGDRWPLNKTFVQRYFKRWNEYPNFQSEGSYVTLYMLKNAIERANKLAGGWPDDEMIIGQLEGLGMDTPSGYIYIRPDNHQGYKDAVTGFSKNNPEYPFPTWDQRPDHHHSDPQHHRARQLAEARQWAQRVDRRGELDQDHLAEGRGLRRLELVIDTTAPGHPGRGWFLWSQLLRYRRGNARSHGFTVGPCVDVA